MNPTDKSKSPPDFDSVFAYFRQLQDQICHALEQVDGGDGFIEDTWQYDKGGGGRSRVLEQGAVFEKAGVNFSEVFGSQLPESATRERPQITGKPFRAGGVSLVIHPRNPFVPTCHMNVRLIVADYQGDNPAWWFGGGYDLTPYYPFEEDCRHWHATARDACDRVDTDYYPRFKKWCDDYFFLKHRNETRGIGGLFFDDFVEGGFDHSLALVKSVGDSFIDAYLPIVKRRRHLPWSDEQETFQQIRRGRYVEFNLVYDRGTIFGLQSGGRTESILMSLPPRVQWRYDMQLPAGSLEAKLVTDFLRPRDWLSDE